MSIEIKALGLSDEETATLEKMFAEGDEDGIERVMSKIVAIHALKQETEQLKFRVMQDVLLNAHFLLHENRHDEALSLLCPIVATIEGDPPPMEVVMAVREKLKQVNAEREKSSCEGSA